VSFFPKRKMVAIRSTTMNADRNIKVLFLFMG
jgi:hypothetical protein